MTANCARCLRDFKNLRGLALHIRKTHKNAGPMLLATELATILTTAYPVDVVSIVVAYAAAPERDALLHHATCACAKCFKIRHGAAEELLTHPVECGCRPCKTFLQIYV